MANYQQQNRQPDTTSLYAGTLAHSGSPAEAVRLLPPSEEGRLHEGSAAAAGEAVHIVGLDDQTVHVERHVVGGRVDGGEQVSGASGEDEEPTQEHEVEAIIDHRETVGGTEYKVRWKGCLPSGEDDTWEPRAHLDLDGVLNVQLEIYEQSAKPDPPVAALARGAAAALYHCGSWGGRVHKCWAA